MPRNLGVSNTFAVPRIETRVPMEVGVQISGHAHLPGLETTFTQDVSSRGARVVSLRKWFPNDRLFLNTLTGAFRSVARVAYCQSMPGSGYAIGLEFLEPAGDWVVNGGSER